MSRIYRFGKFDLDPRRRTLSRAGSPVPLTSKAFDVLVYLVQNPNRLVSKEELLQAVWRGTLVEEGNLTQYISHLRKALGDSAEDAQLILTIARKGYQFAEDVVLSDTAVTLNHAGTEISSTERLRTDSAPVSGISRMEWVPSSWRKVVFVAAAIFLLAFVGYMSWQRVKSSAQTSTGKVTLAVLPFENLTGDPNQEYLADGLTEETISELGRLDPDHLGVIARTSVMRYKKGNVRLDQIGRELSVQYVLENSLREGGGRIRLSAQLIQVKEQTQLWSKEYDYALKDALTVEDEVAKAVASQIQLTIKPRQQTELSQPPAVNPEAFDAYLRGYYFFERSDSEKDTEMARAYFERATQLDPSYALAWVGLSRARYWQANIGVIPVEQGQRLARESVERALALDPNLPEAHSQMSRIRRQVDYDWVGADAAIRRAVALDPRNPRYLGEAAFMADLLGRFDEAVRLESQAIESDPLDSESWEQLGEIKYYAGRFDEAVAAANRSIELNPDTWGSPDLLCEIYVAQGRPQDALRKSELIQAGSFRARTRTIAYTLLGQKKEANASLQELIANYHASAAWSIATVYALRGQHDQAFEWLNRAYAQHDGGLIFIGVEPLLKNLHSDSRYAAFLKKLHMPT